MRFAKLFTVFSSLWLSCAVSAQSYPVKPIKVIVPFAPGTGPEQTVRHMMERFHKSTGQTLVIENKGGAGGNISPSILCRRRTPCWPVCMHCCPGIRSHGKLAV